MGASRGPSDHRASVRRPDRAGVRPDPEAVGHPEARDASSRTGIPEAREVPDIWYQFATPFVVDGSAFDTAFASLQITPLAQAVHDTAAWYQATAKAA